MKVKSFIKRIGSFFTKLGKGLKPLLVRIGAFFSKLGKRLKPAFVRIGAVFAKLGKSIRTALMQLPPLFRAVLMGTVGIAVVAMVIVIVAVAARKRGTEAVLPVADLTDYSTPVAGDLNNEEQTLISEADETPIPDAEEEPTPTPHPLDGIAYERGDSGDVIISLQERLMDLGYLDSDEPTDYFGSLTEDALTAFQKHNELTADGILGASTYDVLFSDEAKIYVMQSGDSGDDVEAVQERLYQLGYLAKSYITGNFGEKTLAAVMEFQSANKLTADGKVGEKTISALYSDDVVSNSFKHGDVDDTIAKYQQRLIKLGYLEDDFEADGRMDSETVAAIKLFQDANGLTRDGCLGPATMEALDSSDALSYALRLGMSGSKVKEVQQRLYKLGYLRSSQVTSYFGEATQAAIISFQKRNSLTADGAVGSKTTAKLFSDSAKEAASTAVSPDDSDDSSSSSSSNSSGSTSNSSGVEKFIEIAKSKLGCKYVRGAKGPNTFDCSGFVYWCLNQAGVKQGYLNSIGWRTVTKYKRITNMNDLKRGDILVFSGATATGKGHVGIYLGNNQMIDAGSSKGAVVIRSSIRTNYWTSHFLMAYRIWD
ncbi:MAG: peptidoglycan-binding protein [Clostridia bacterium]|nr:peptidoglycan-binding protein [Clostridia bacterium]